MQGQLTTAWEYLGIVPVEPPTAVAELSDRVFRSMPPGLGLDDQNPPFPFIGQEVTPAPAPQSEHSYPLQEHLPSLQSLHAHAHLKGMVATLPQTEAACQC